MAITTKIAGRYAARIIVAAAVCTVFGLWGIYDYTIKIPRRQLLTDRLQMLTQCREALETTQLQSWLVNESKEALEAISLQRLTFDESSRQDRPDLASSLEFASSDEFKQKLGEIAVSRDDVRWLMILAVIEEGLKSKRALPLQDYPPAFAAYQLTSTAIDVIGPVTAPAKYDRIMQWGFISCLPFVPYFLWGFVVARRKVYELDDNDTLHMPDGAWKADQIADIDMSRWMAKSIAYVVHSDGTRVKLDDYKHQSLHLIIGAVASRLYPGRWDAEANAIDTTPPGQTDGSGAPAPAASPATAASGGDPPSA